LWFVERKPVTVIEGVAQCLWGWADVCSFDYSIITTYFQPSIQLVRIRKITRKNHKRVEYMRHNILHNKRCKLPPERAYRNSHIITLQTNPKQ